MFRFPKVSAERTREIVREVSHGSKARGRFFVLLITASMIASFGLIANSTAVIIGAMLVSPLMTPIFGAALGILRGNPRLLGWSLWSEAIGITLAVGAAYLVGIPQLSFGDATPEMLARTQPNLLDLLVAVFAGFAGAYAMLDERVSPALPGVAIATAIVPPLATCGLCLSLGAWSGAGGAMLLFLANFVSILLVALAVFWAGGLARKGMYSRRRVFGHIGLTTTAFVVVVVILTNSLLRITKDRALESGIHKTLEEELALKHGTDLEELMHCRTSKGVQVLATVRSHSTISPRWVTAIEDRLESALGEPVDLVVRTIRSRDVCALGASLQVVHPNLDGDFLVEMSDDFEARESLASQVVREFFEDEPGFELTRIEYGISNNHEGVIVAYANSIRRLSKQEFGALESVLQERFNDPALHLFVSMNVASLQGRDGPQLVEWSNVQSAAPERAGELPGIREAIRIAVKHETNNEPIRMHFNWTGDHWRALVEVFGGEGLSPSAVAKIRSELPEQLAQRVELLIWRKSDFVVTEEGYSDYDTLVDSDLLQRSEQLRGLFQVSTLPSTTTSHKDAADSLLLDE
ncbi:DUF389 domain-containing protein [Bremerella sp. P1]|uniref:DUF389 domain-containing protein n=1 Tax=Bremerella sp. P1 TaxID=3026424 RepID=UPI0023688557|nr:DUF389 domain-containing protein [Bremerella sp. P1]WDI41994.1 DUF389 domain-containing protein [Bremerella sp. P1]